MRMFGYISVSSEFDGGGWRVRGRDYDGGGIFNARDGCTSRRILPSYHSPIPPL